MLTFIEFVIGRLSDTEYNMVSYPVVGELSFDQTEAFLMFGLNEVLVKDYFLEQSNGEVYCRLWLFDQGNIETVLNQFIKNGITIGPPEEKILKY